MYLPHANNVVQALDATTGDLIWEYRREPAFDPAQRSFYAFDFQRSLAIWEDKIIYLTSDNAILALDAINGQVVWETQIRDPEGAGGFAVQSSGPVIANGLAISGRSCMEPQDCFIAAHDLT